jgi:hypothetical protein
MKKQGSDRFSTEMFNLRKLSNIQDEEKFCVGASKRFAALEDLVAQMEINSAWETIRENINISFKEI